MDERPMYDRGLQFDISTLMGRRRVLGLFAGTGLTVLAGCTSDGSGGTASSPTTPAAGSSLAATGGSCEKIPAETAGPYPGDGSNGPNILTRNGIVRSDIRSSFGTASGKADGVALTVTLTVQDTAKGCAAIAGAAVYIWHCDRVGNYSMYTQAAVNENFLRGVQETDSKGSVSFTSIFPGAYTGRWPHIHFEVYPSLTATSAAANKIATSQLAFPEDVCNAVYATKGYEASVRRMQQTPLSDDSVFREDNAEHQLATMTGSVAAGYTATLVVPI